MGLKCFRKERLRVRWLIEGDSNTQFFLLSTLRRRQKNRIIEVKYLNGNLIVGEAEFFFGQLGEAEFRKHFETHLEGGIGMVPKSQCVPDGGVPECIFMISFGKQSKIPYMAR